MSKVSELLQATRSGKKEVFSVSPSTSILEAVRFAREKNVGALPVLDGDRLVGIISERDFAFKILAEGFGPDEFTVEDFMTCDPDCVGSSVDLTYCLSHMREKGVRHLPVVDEGKLVGIVSLRDVLFALLERQESLSQLFEAYLRSPF